QRRDGLQRVATEVVEQDDFVLAAQSFGEVRADEAGAAGNQNAFHFSSNPRDSAMMNGGRPRASSSVRHKYSPMMPSMTSCVPPSTSSTTISDAQPPMVTPCMIQAVMTNAA